VEFINGGPYWIIRAAYKEDWLFDEMDSGQQNPKGRNSQFNFFFKKQGITHPVHIGQWRPL